MAGMTRRGFLAAGAAACAAAPFPRMALAQPGALPLKAATRVLDIDGRAATVFGLQGPAGQGLVLNPGQRFLVDLHNALDEATLIHWHGQIPPNVQDGVPDLPLPALAPGESRRYDYAPLPGTYWMHAHIPLQEMRLLAAPLIVRSPQDVAEDRQEVVMFLHDFAFKSSQEIMEEIAGSAAAASHGGHAAAPDGGAPAMGRPMGQGMGHSMGHGGMMMGQGGMSHGGMGGMAMDLNDYDWDAYLTNDRTLSDPEVIRVERGGRLRVRVINAASATVFWFDSGVLDARLVAVDGHAVQPQAGTRFGLAMGQRLDLEIDLPQMDGAWPLLALREGARERSGLVVATPGAMVRKIGALSTREAPAFDTDLMQEQSLVGLDPLPQRAADVRYRVMLSGSMQPYRWAINGRTWGDHIPLTARTGQRVELSFHNMSMMAHPMHLHGHVFQVVAINGRRFAGARRDTVHVPPMTHVTIAFDAGEAARWMLHCHHMPHLQMGMMTELALG
ncbi:multicopper oxidase family protein [Bordetella trematum]|uniref:multicopper oxidase family protein n=1 Tax=Bordetella trematum TaxID=123899 RepID=UPI00046F72FE|nr:multicopper oxidase domain-containing protein [Bordetella trematum]